PAADERVRQRRPGSGAEPAHAGQRARAVDRLRPLPADRRPLLRRRDGLLGQLRLAQHLPEQRQQPAARQPGAAAVQRSARHLLGRIVNLQLSLFTSGSAYPEQDGAPYVIPVGTWNADGTITYYTTMDQIHQGIVANGATRPFQGYYGPEARLMLMIARKNG